jgi:hypothetical protein
MANPEETPTRSGDFERLAGESPAGLVREVWDFLRYNRKWWLFPIFLVLALVGVLVVLGGTAAAPLIYTLF